MANTGDGRHAGIGKEERGHAGVLEFFQAVNECWEFEAFEPREFIASGELLARIVKIFMRRDCSIEVIRRGVLDSGFQVAERA